MNKDIDYILKAIHESVGSESEKDLAIKILMQINEYNDCEANSDIKKSIENLRKEKMNERRI